MASSIFGNQAGSSIMGAVEQLRAMGDPQAAFQGMYQTDPRFRQFADSMRGKTPEQAFRENGLDFGPFRNLMR